jgi:hypothetical protein
MPALHAVVELCLGDRATWISLPPGDAPLFVRLHSRVTDAEIAQVVQTRAVYGSISTGGSPLSPQELITSSRFIMPGGLAAIDGQRRVDPSCCCGIEAWRDWEQLLASGQSPWLGHDPSPFVEAVAGGFRVWPEGGDGEAPPAPDTAIFFTREALTNALSNVEDDLQGFLRALERWAAIHAPDHVGGLDKAFRRTLSLSTSGRGA